MANARLSVRLDPQTQQRLKKAAHATGKSESELVREALAAYFSVQDQQESCLDLAQRHGLIGRAKGLPADLSTNRDHFKGFGQ